MLPSNRTHQPTPNTASASVDAERHVFHALQRQGWTILARNARHIGFELDIVAAKGPTLIIVEVKARRQRPDCERALTQLLPRKKREALLRGAAAMASRLHISYDTVRIDLAVVYQGPQGRPRIDYHVDAVKDY